MYDFSSEIDRKGSSSIKWDFQKKDYNRDGILPFGIADSDFMVAPEVRERLKKRIDGGVFGYTLPDGKYYDDVVSWCSRRHGLKIKRDWIVPTGCIVSALFDLVDCLTEKGDGVIIEPPVYDPFFSVVNGSGRKVVECPLIHDEGRYRMDYAKIGKACKDGAKAMILCSPHNPVSRVWSEDELRKLADIVKEYGILLISDEIHWDLMLFGSKHVSMAAFDDILDNVIVTISPSKTFNIAGLQTSSTLIKDKAMRERFQAYLSVRSKTCVNALGYEALKACYELGDKWVDEELAHLSSNAQIVLDFFKENSHLNVSVAKPEGTYLLWLDMRSHGKTSDELVGAFAKAGAGLNSGKHYGNGYDGFVRMNIACPERQLRKGLEIIKGALEAM